MRSIGSKTDQDILLLYATGKTREGYTCLVTHYRKPLFQIFERWLGPGGQVRGKQADDLTQDTLERVHKRLWKNQERVDSLPAMLYMQARSIKQGATRPSPDALDHVSSKEVPLSHPEVPSEPGLLPVWRSTPPSTLPPGTELPPVQATDPNTTDTTEEPGASGLDLEVKTGPTPEIMVHARRLREAFLDCLHRLPNLRHREAFQLWLLGETNIQIATRLGWKGFEGAVTAVKSARRLVVSCLRDKGEEIPEGF